MHTSKTITLDDKRSLSIETNDVAKQAHGAVIIRQNNAMLLATVVVSEEAEKSSFLPLYVDYREKFFGAGRIPGGFLKRESKPTEHEIITSRLIDRTIRPLFSDNFHHAIQINVTLLSVDENVNPDSLAILGASSALAISPIPFSDLVAGVRIGEVNGKLVVNPTPKQLESTLINVFVAGTAERVLMLEGSTAEITEDRLLEIIEFAHQAIQRQCMAQREFSEKAGKAKYTGMLQEITEEEKALQEELHQKLYPLFYEVVSRGIQEKQPRSQAFKEAQKGVLETLDPDVLTEHAMFIYKCIENIKKEAIRTHILTSSNNQRIDGRTPEDIRPIEMMIDYIPSAHGSALFKRGDTQVLATLTLGSTLDVQYLRGVSAQGTKNFLVHYNFPSFSTGQIKPDRGPSRREIGHGNLVENALNPVLPDSPYTVRLTAEVLSSDGSSSMASTCGSSLACMDAGIDLQKAVAGIAMGLIFDPESQKSIILSDITSEEDFCGNADFKITGTQNGITACQMDLKTKGIPLSTLKALLMQARKGRLHILEKMGKIIDKPRSQKKPQAPVFAEICVKASMIGTVIGPRGQTIQQLQEETGATIQVDDKGVVHIFAPNREAAAMAQEKISLLVSEPTIQKVYKGQVKAFAKSKTSDRIYGAFIEFLPGKDGLLHISEMAEAIEDPQTALQIGEEVTVKLIDIVKSKERGGRVKFSLSMKQIETS